MAKLNIQDKHKLSLQPLKLKSILLNVNKQNLRAEGSLRSLLPASADGLGQASASRVLGSQGLHHRASPAPFFTNQKSSFIDLIH